MNIAERLRKLEGKIGTGPATTPELTTSQSYLQSWDFPTDLALEEHLAQLRLDALAAGWRGHAPYVIVATFPIEMEAELRRVAYQESLVSGIGE